MKHHTASVGDRHTRPVGPSHLAFVGASDIAALRAREGATQELLARACNCTVGTIASWEQGRKIPRGPAQRLLQIINTRGLAVLETEDRRHA